MFLLQKNILIILNIFIFILIFKINFFLALPFSFDKFFLSISLILLFFFPPIKNTFIFSKTVLFLIILTLYGVLISLNYNNEINHHVYRYLLFTFESLTLSFFIIGIYLNVLKKDLDYILKVIFYCILFQSIFILFSFISSSVFKFLDVITPLEGTNFDQEISFRLYRGLSNVSGASHSIIMSIGALLAFYLFIKSKKPLYLITLLPLFFAAAINGRTGIVLILIFAIIFFILTFNFRNSLKPILTTTLLLISLNYTTSYFFSYSTRSDEITSWVLEAFSIFDSSKKSEQNFYNSFEDNHLFLPKSNFEIFLGAGYDPDLYLNNEGSDSGVIKNIYSFGIILTIILYLLLIRIIFKSGIKRNKPDLYLSIGIILILIFGDFKEPFLVKTFLAKLIFIVVIGRNYLNKNKIYL